MRICLISWNKSKRILEDEAAQKAALAFINFYNCTFQAIFIIVFNVNHEMV